MRFKCFAQQRPVLGVVVAQERLVQAALAQALDGLDRFASRRAARRAAD